jgi:hypothetical protein
MPKLNDTQLVLLSSAAKRDDRSFYPLPATISSGPRATTALASLLKSGFASERDTNDLTISYRQDGDLNIGVFVTDAGLATIGVEPEGAGDVVFEAPQQAERTSKRDTVVALLSRGEGATLPELISTTGWLPHTTRAALTGLRKKGHSIERSKRGADTCYRIVVPA